MSSMASTRGGSWAQAWLAGAFVPFAISTTLCLAIDAWRGLGSEQGLDFADWSPGILPFAMITAIIAAIVAWIFVFLVRFVENNGPKPLSIWLLLGLAAATPIVLLFEGFVAVEPFYRMTITPRDYVVPAFYLYLASVLGALTAWRIRRGAWRA